MGDDFGIKLSAFLFIVTGLIGLGFAMCQSMDKEAYWSSDKVSEITVSDNQQDLGVVLYVYEGDYGTDEDNLYCGVKPGTGDIIPATAEDSCENIINQVKEVNL